MENSFSPSNGLTVDELYTVTDALIKANTDEAFRVAVKVGFAIAERRLTKVKRPRIEFDYHIQSSDVRIIMKSLLLSKDNSLIKKVFEAYSISSHSD